MNILVIGLGSMGKRRIRNLQALGEHAITGFDRDARVARDARKRYGITLLETLDATAARSFDVAFISTPPGTHLPFARHCAEQGIPFFVELNLNTKEASAIERVATQHRVRSVPSDTELFDNDIIQLGEVVGSRFKGYFVFHVGLNIHDWHPWQKEGEHFIFNPNTNGIREILRAELPWILRTFGAVATVTAHGARFETKQYLVDDFFSLELQFTNGNRGVIVLDLLTPTPIKRMDIVSGERLITWHERRNMITIAHRGGKKSMQKLGAKQKLKKYAFHENAHLAETKQVLAVLTGKEKPKFTFAQELDVLRLIDTIERTRNRTNNVIA